MRLAILLLALASCTATVVDPEPVDAGDDAVAVWLVTNCAHAPPGTSCELEDGGAGVCSAVAVACEP